MKTKISLFLIFAALLFSSCGGPSNEPNEGPSYHSPSKQITAFEPMTPVNYGNGVYYFSVIRKQFGISLSAFLADTSKQLISVTGDGTDSYGFDQGYWVVVKEK